MTSSIRVALLALCLTVNLGAQQYHSFDLDVPPGRFAFWQIDDLGDADRLDGTFEVVELRHDRTWFPAFQIRLERDGMGLSLSFIREGAKGPLLARIDALERGKRQGGRVIDNWRIEPGKAFQLSLNWSAKDVLVVANDSREVGRFRLDVVPKTLVVSASTGEWKGRALALRGPSSK